MIYRWNMPMVVSYANFLNSRHIKEFVRRLYGCEEESAPACLNLHYGDRVVEITTYENGYVTGVARLTHFPILTDIPLG